MPAEINQTTLSARIKIRYDTYANWTSYNPTLMLGEMAIVEIGPAVQDDDGVPTNPPTLLLKVGDGTTPFNNLGWVSALAADVYEWAKGAQKPVYDYEEIQNKPTVEAKNETLIFTLGGSSEQQ